MIFSSSSLLISILLAAILVIVQQFLLSHLVNRKYYQISFLSCFSLIIFLRLVFPVEFINTHTFSSYKILPALYSIGRIKFSIAQATFSIKSFLEIIWLSGSLIMLLRLVTSWYQLLGFARSLRPLPDNYLNESLKKIVPSNVQLNYLPLARTPSTIGVFHCKIIFTKLNLSDWEKEVILKHEMQHIKKHDNLKLYLIEFLICIYWWFPLIYLFKRQVREIIEMNVDFQLVHRGNPGFYQSYTKCLLTVYDKISQRTPTQFNSSFILTEDDTLKNRLIFLLTEPKIKQTFWLLKVALVTLPLTLTSVIVEPYFSNSSKTKGTYTLDSRDPETYILQVKQNYYLIAKGKMLGKINNFRILKSPQIKHLPIKVAIEEDNDLPPLIEPHHGS